MNVDLVSTAFVDTHPLEQKEVPRMAKHRARTRIGKARRLPPKAKVT
jgi:hypothetical protein